MLHEEAWKHVMLVQLKTSAEHNAAACQFQWASTPCGGLVVAGKPSEEATA
jgi:hypothetical protein